MAMIQARREVVAEKERYPGFALRESYPKRQVVEEQVKPRVCPYCQKETDKSHWVERVSYDGYTRVFTGTYNCIHAKPKAFRCERCEAPLSED